MKVIESKSILAKLLATENISVEHQKVSTAAFDVKNRKLILPHWENMSNSLYDLLLGHEVGHARFTPPEGWHDAVSDEPAKKGFLNVLEDVRIERFIKKQYPGLVKSFYSGYRELFDRDFFGVADTDVDTLPLIDRINLHYKIGSFLNVQFTDAEKAILKRLEAAETWDEIAALADELYVSAKEEKEQEPEQGGGSSDEEGEQESGDDAGDQEADDQESEEEGDDATDGEPEDTDSDYSMEEDTQEVSVMEEYNESDEPYSITDEAFRENEEQLVDNSEKRDTRYINIPKMNIEKFIVSPKKLYGNLEDSFNAPYYSASLEDMANEMYAEFKRKNVSVVNNMIQQFELKRKAAENLKARVSKTGDLNEDRLWAYKISEDLFKQSTILPKGKNHGMIMFLDMSGSMARQIKSTIEQMLTLVMFCQKINVPFDVYGFTNTNISNCSNSNEAEEGDFVVYDLNMPHLFSSSFTKTQTVSAFKHLLMLGECMNNRGYGSEISLRNRDFRLGATPLNSTMLVGIEIAKRFRATHRVEILNTIVLTDGGATDTPSYMTDRISDWSQERIYSNVGWNENVVFKYGSVSIGFEAGHSRYTPITAAALELYKQVTGSTLINYHLMSRWTEREFVDVYNDYYRIDNPKFNYTDSYAVWSKDRKDGMVAVKDPVGFDTRFIMKSSKIDIEDEELTVKSNSKGDLLRGFRKFAGNKRGQRIFVNKFMDLVA